MKSERKIENKRTKQKIKTTNKTKMYNKKILY